MDPGGGGLFSRVRGSNRGSQRRCYQSGMDMGSIVQHADLGAFVWAAELAKVEATAPMKLKQLQTYRRGLVAAWTLLSEPNDSPSSPVPETSSLADPVLMPCTSPSPQPLHPGCLLLPLAH
ncbi:hypothetical protein HaLaN_08153 [Haematococcus lacustris]|uniref:Uncharacterized protein n=1 Tax=Haematococcus lacustris TaxID=44745 RepID=A0A699YYE7_HAELA|nr:hypothetical protein HaLaN_08153 [Haematococcus lacustris]